MSQLIDERRWEANKDTICSLYGRMRLVEVMAEMEKVHDFSATPRQYKKHLRTWCQRKNLKRHEKDDMLRRADDDSNFSNTEVRKLMRHLREAQQRHQEEKTCSTQRMIERQNSDHGDVHSQANDHIASTPAPDSSYIRNSRVRRGLSIPRLQTGQSPNSSLADTPGTSGNAHNHEQQIKGDFPRSNHPVIPTTTPQRNLCISKSIAEQGEGSSLDQTRQCQTLDPFPEASSTHDEMMQWDFHRAILAMVGDESKIVTLARSLRTSKSDWTPHMWDITKEVTSIHSITQEGCINIIRRNIHLYCLTDARHLIDDPNMDLSSKTTAEGRAKQFWSDIKYAIYLFKSSSQAQAWPALQAAFAEAKFALGVRSFNFIRELLTTLSPLNTSRCPDIRRELLNNFYVLAHQQLGDVHPLTLIIEQLCKDGGSQQVSQQAMAYMVEQFMQAVGPRSPVTFRVRLAYAKMLRRSREYSAAARLARDLLALSLEHTSPDAVWCRLAARELSHVLMDLGHHNEAIALSKDAVGYSRPEFRHPVSTYNAQTSQDSCPSVVLRHVDETAVYSMEDIAMSYDKLGDFEQSAFWLELAVKYAWDLWKDWVATKHIIDKLERVLKACGRGDEGLATMWRMRCRTDDACISDVIYAV